MMLELLEQIGSLRVLVAVLEKQRYISELHRTSINPQGIASLDALKKVRRNLSELGLITEEIEEGPRPKTFLVITDKGKLVAEKVREILDILEG